MGRPGASTTSLARRLGREEVAKLYRLAFLEPLVTGRESYAVVSSLTISTLLIQALSLRGPFTPRERRMPSPRRCLYRLRPSQVFQWLCFFFHGQSWFADESRLDLLDH